MLCFFNVAGAIYDPDTQGFEFATMTDARIEAVRYAAEVLNDRPEIVLEGEELRIEVTDATRLLLFTFIATGVDAPAANGVL